MNGKPTRSPRWQHWRRRGWRDFFAIEQALPTPGDWTSATPADVDALLSRLPGDVSEERLAGLWWASEKYATLSTHLRESVRRSLGGPKATRLLADLDALATELGIDLA